MVPLTLSLVFGSALRAAGDTRTPLAIGAAANLVNIALGWALIYGRFGFPALGVAGAGIAATVAVTLQLPVFFWLWRSGRLRVAPAGATARPDRVVMSRLLHIGYPAAIEGILFQAGLWFFMRLLAPYGTQAVAADNVGAQILAFSFLPGLCFRVLPAAIAALVFHAPLNVVWGMLIFDYAVKATLLVGRFARGRWKTVTV